MVTGNFFQALGVRPALGRVLDVSDDKPSAAAAAVVSWRYWKSRFNGDQRVLGSAIDIEDTRVPAPMHVTVVGVAEPGFSGIVVGYRPDVWISLSAVPGAMRSRAGLALAARLAPGVSIEQARAEMRVLDRARIDALAQRDPVAQRRNRCHAGAHRTFDPAASAVRRAAAAADDDGRRRAAACVRQHRQPAACARRRAAASGGTRVARRGPLRIVRQVLTESLLLAAMGGVLGIVCARLGATMLMRIMMSDARSPGPSPHLDIPLDARVLMFTVAVTVLAALSSGSCLRSPRSCPPRAGFAAERRRRAAIPAPLRQRSGGRAGGHLPGAPERVAAVHRTSAPPARSQPRLRSPWCAADLNQHVARRIGSSSRHSTGTSFRAWRRFRACVRLRRAGRRRCHGRSEPLPAGRRIRRTCAGQAAGIAELGVSQLFRHLWNAAAGGAGLPRR